MKMHVNRAIARKRPGDHQFVSSKAECASARTR